MSGYRRWLSSPYGPANKRRGLGSEASPSKPQRSRLLLGRDLRVDAVDVDALLPADIARPEIPEQPERHGSTHPVDDVLLCLQPEERIAEERPVQEHGRKDRPDAGDHGQRDPRD